MKKLFYTLSDFLHKENDTESLFVQKAINPISFLLFGNQSNVCRY